MLIKYCNKCAGRPYTTDLDQNTCPICGTYMQIERIDESELATRQKLSFTSLPQNDPLKNTQDNNRPEVQPRNPSPVPPVHRMPMMPSRPAAVRSADSPCVVRGKVFQYSSSGKEDGTYRRFFWQRWIDAMVYHQRMEDVLHRFHVRMEGETDVYGNTVYRDVPVNVHGTIASGMQIVDNSQVEVTGKYRNGVLMAERVVLLNDGYRSQVKFQRSASAIIYGILALAVLIYLIVMGVSTDGAFFENIGNFLTTWLICAVIVTVLYFVSMFSRAGILSRLLFGGQRGFPFLGIVLISLLLALIFTNSFGLGSAVGGFFSGILGAIIPVAIVILIIVFVFKGIFKP